MLDYLTFRATFDGMGVLYAAAAGVTTRAESFNGISCYWYEPEDALPDELLIYVHGGGFVGGSVLSHGPMASHIARYTRRRLLFVDYVLAPEHPFPAGAAQVLRIAGSLRQVYPNHRIGMLGDSAGGNLVLKTGLSLLAGEQVQPDYYVLLSPWLDLRISNASYTLNAGKDEVLNRQQMEEYVELYAGDMDAADPLLSPVLAELKGLNRILILCGTAEILEDDSRLLYARLLAAGVAATYVPFDNAQHVWTLPDIHSVDAQRALALIKEFMQ